MQLGLTRKIRNKWYDWGDEKYNLAPKENGVIGIHKGNKL